MAWRAKGSNAYRRVDCAHLFRSTRHRVAGVSPAFEAGTAHLPFSIPENRNCLGDARVLMNHLAKGLDNLRRILMLERISTNR